METLIGLLFEKGTLVVIAAIFLWQYIVETQEKKKERGAQAAQTKDMIEVVANNNLIAQRNIAALENIAEMDLRQQQSSVELELQITSIEEKIVALHNLVQGHNKQAEDIYNNLLKEIKSLKKA